MKTYDYPSRMFRKRWYWFSAPQRDYSGDIINCFAYEKVDISGYKRKQGITSVIDLTLSQESIEGNMRKRFVREQVAKGIRNNISISIGTDWKSLTSLYREFRKGKLLSEDDPRVFEHCLMVTATYQGEVIAGGAFVEDGQYIRAHALFSKRFSDDGRMREIVGQANRMLVVKTIEYAKSQGYLLFDLGGISPESIEREDVSLTEFKESFGGVRRECYYYTKVNSRALKLLIRIRRFLHV